MFAIGNRTTVLLAAAFAVTFNSFDASAASKGKLPAPANFRVVAKTAYTVTLAWDAAMIGGSAAETRGGVSPCSSDARRLVSEHGQARTPISAFYENTNNQQ